MAEHRHIICRSSDLIERGRGRRFRVRWGQEIAPAFVVRFQGRAHAYLNRCVHRSLELDWNEGDFFDATGSHLVCATHGARYAPNSGHCLGGATFSRGEGCLLSEAKLFRKEDAGLPQKAAFD